jgi:DNA repair photolyase
MVTEIEARVLLATVKQPDTWFGLRYNMNLYRGCQHQCIYCDSRSECYRIDDFSAIQAKTNALELLPKELKRKRIVGTIGTGSMHDPYMPIEARLNLTGRALQMIAEHHFPVHVITKSDLVLRDLETLVELNRVYAAVSLTITTADDELCRKIEPGAPPASRRFAAIAALAARGVVTGVTMMPILPFIEDNEETIRAIVTQAHAAGARYILPGFAVTLRDRQREYYYARLDKLFPGLRQQYERRYGTRYVCASPRAARLELLFRELCDQYGIATHMPVYNPNPPEQLALL